MHDCSFGLIGPRQVHAEYKMHTCMTIYTLIQYGVWRQAYPRNTDATCRFQWQTWWRRGLWQFTPVSTSWVAHSLDRKTIGMESDTQLPVYLWCGSLHIHQKLSEGASGLKNSSDPHLSAHVLNVLRQALLSVVKAWVGEIPCVPYVSMEMIAHSTISCDCGYYYMHHWRLERPWVQPWSVCKTFSTVICDY